MLLLIDVGNTNIVMGLYDGDVKKYSWRLATRQSRTSDEYGLQVESILSHYGISRDEIHDIVIGSVVPSIQHTLKTMCSRYLNIDPMIVGEGTKTGMPIKYDNPREVGADRVANSVAIIDKYKLPAILIDIGTAISFDVVNEKGEFIGGAIAPGIGIASEALFSRTSKLPKVELEVPDKAIGSNTIHAIQSGIVYGYIGLVDNIIENIVKDLKCDPKDVSIIATGGYASLISQNSKYIQEYDYDITLHGMKLIYNRTIKERNE
ncbi:MAG: type III pantothenate kinase [Tissierellia bacterium]|nr:type III pantothenate kinase [Tissierellia bacterium]